MTMRRMHTIALSLTLAFLAQTAFAGLAAPNADLGITKSGSASTATPGSNFTYALTVTNAGPDAVQPTVADTLPANTTLLIINAPAYSCSGVAPGATGTLVCTRPTLLASGGTDTITLTVNVNPSATGTIVNNATVSAVVGLDPNSTNNNATVTTPIGVNADVAVIKTASAVPFPAGGNVAFSITATNNGPATATGVTVTDTVPAGTTLVSANSTQGTCTGSPTVTCSVGTLGSGASATITFIVQSSATPGTITNTASVSAAETDPNTANNSSTASATTAATTPGIPALSPWMLGLLAAALAVVALKARF